MVAGLATVPPAATAQAFAIIRGDGGEVLAIGRLSIADGLAGITAVAVTQARRRAGLGMALTRAICAEAAARGARQVFLLAGDTPGRMLRPGQGSRYVCNHGYPCVQGLGSFAKRAGRR